MNRQTRKMLLNLATGIAVAVTAALAFLPATQAAPGVVTSNVNVRSGPGTNYAVVTAITSGTRVDVQRCDRGFCQIEARRISGWVSAQYLSAGGRPVNPNNPGLSFGFNVGGPGGPNITIGIGNGNNNQRPPVVRPRPTAQVCFFDRARFRGASECYRSGDTVPNLGRLANRFQSMQNDRGLTVQVCTDRNFRNCRTYTTSAAALGGFGNNVASIRIR